MAKRPVLLYDFAAFGQAIKEARMGRNGRNSGNIFSDVIKRKKAHDTFYGVMCLFLVKTSVFSYNKTNSVDMFAL